MEGHSICPLPEKKQSVSHIEKRCVEELKQQCFDHELQHGYLSPAQEVSLPCIVLTRSTLRRKLEKTAYRGAAHKKCTEKSNKWNKSTSPFFLEQSVIMSKILGMPVVRVIYRYNTMRPRQPIPCRETIHMQYWPSRHHRRTIGSANVKRS